MTHTIQLTTDQLGELHLTIAERLEQVKSTLNHSNPIIAEISQRQVNRIQPMYDMIQQMMIEAHSN